MYCVIFKLFESVSMVGRTIQKCCKASRKEIGFEKGEWRRETARYNSKTNRTDSTFQREAKWGKGLSKSHIAVLIGVIELVGQRYPFAPPIIQVRIFENIETTSETKTRNLTILPDIYHNENNYFNYFHLMIFKIFKPSLSAKLTCRAYWFVYISLAL